MNGSVLCLVVTLILTSICFWGFTSNISSLVHVSFDGQKYRSLHRPFVHLDSFPNSQVMLIEAAYDGFVFMDWTLSSDSFCYINYKSLESVLAVYSNARVVINIIAPFQSNYYKVGTMLNKHYFQKYTKQGHNVTIDLLFQQYSPALSDIHSEAPPGSAYWNLQMAKCCVVDSVRSLRTEKHVAFHQYFYSRIISLYKRGGVFSDFTWLHSASVVTPGVEGLVLLIDCDPLVTRSSERNTSGCFTSTLMVFPANSTVLLCALRLFDKPESTFMQCLASDAMTEGAHCILDAFRRCFEQSGRLNSLLDQFRVGGGAFADTYGHVDATRVAAHHHRLWKVENTGSNASLDKVGVEWLGRAAYMGDWQLPEAGSLLDEFLVLQDAALAARIRSFGTVTCALNASIACHHFQTRTDKLAVFSAQHARQASVSCAPHFVLAGFMKAGTTHLFELLMAHPQLLRALRGVLFKETGCYLPAQMISADKAGQRMACFPFLEATARGLRFGDGTVYYAARQEVPGYLLGDNPDVRVLFTVRHPVQRTESHHRFNYKFFLSKGLGDLNLCVEIALDRSRGPLMEFFDLAQKAMQATSDFERNGFVSNLVKRYQAGMTRSSGRGQHSQQYLHCANLVFHSLYFPALQHWTATLPRPLSHMLVVPAERLDVRRWNASQKLAALSRPTLHMSHTASASAAKQHTNVIHTDLVEANSRELSQADRRLSEAYLRIQLNAIAKFLDVCPWTQALPVVDTHKSNGKIVPDEHRLNITMRATLRVFYHPFNWLLDNLLNESFGYND